MARLIALCAVLVAVYFSGVEGECRDTVPNCKDYAKSTCSQYPHFATNKCPFTCKLCKRECPSGWSLYSASKTCLKKTSEKLDWYDAKKNCEKAGGNLVIIRDAAKNNFVKGLVPKGESVWIGIKNVSDKIFLFKYVDGTFTSSFMPWYPNNPDNANGKEHCVTFNRHPDLDGQWNDFNCKAKLAFICEIPEE